MKTKYSEINVQLLVDGFRICSRCEVKKPCSFFGRKRSGLSSQCYECQYRGKLSQGETAIRHRQWFNRNLVLSKQGIRECKRCGEVKLTTDFYTSLGTDGKVRPRSICRDCNTVICRERRTGTPEKAKSQILKEENELLKLDGLRRCSQCGKIGSKDTHASSGGRVGDFGIGRISQCRDCRGINHRAKAFNLSKTVVADLLDAARCALCGSTSPGGPHKGWVFDHDHKCCPDGGRSCGKCIRGVLCASCNLRLGDLEKRDMSVGFLAEYFNVEPEWMKNYLDGYFFRFFLMGKERQ